MKMEQDKKYISPGGWFSLSYPAAWSEFEDGEDSFLFYNPDVWTGNFRISAYRGEGAYADECIRRELAEKPQARRAQVGSWPCAYSAEDFEEEGEAYTTHFWVTGRKDMSFECSFTVKQGEAVDEAERIIRSLEVRDADAKYPPELIPVRLLEIYRINEAYAWVSDKVKEVLKKDFQGEEGDIASMQQLVDKALIAPKKRDAWLSVGIVLCVILANEADGLEWRTLVDGNREAPVLLQVDTGVLIDPMKLVWSKVRVREAIDLPAIYEAAWRQLEQ